MHSITLVLLSISLYLMIAANGIKAQNFTSLGCYVSAQGRDLKAARFSSLKMTRQKCNNFCRKKGYKYAAVQKGQHCFCDNVYGAYGTAKTRQCNKRCAGNRKEICGGNWRNSVLLVGVKPKSLGCYADADTRDLAEKRIINRRLTINFCKNYCARWKYKYFSVQNGDNCFCENHKVGQFRRSFEDKCRVPCGGNKNEFCGGLWRNAIYTAEGKYLGCYVDGSSARIIQDEPIELKQATQEKCYNHCASRGFQFAALRGNRCSCSRSFFFYGKVDNEQCKNVCSGNKNQRCGGVYRINVMQRFVKRKISPCRRRGVCGAGAICRNVRGRAVCSCPRGALGNPRVKCCRQLTCGCYGDPHCHTFDNAAFDFMGRCKYTLATTDCHKRKLPKNLVPFTVLQKQERRKGVPNTNAVSFIRYVEVKVYGSVFRLEKSVNGRHVFLVDNIQRNVPFRGPNGSRAMVIGGEFIFTTTFGLTILWDGLQRAQVLLCDEYRRHVCGLCGNADGNPRNDFVDPRNRRVPAKGHRFTKYFDWGSKWRVRDETTNDSVCDPTKSPGTIEPPKCKDVSVYESRKHCGMIKDPKGPFRLCLKIVSKALVEATYNGCLFDLCALEGSSEQKKYRCNAFKTFASYCYDASNRLGLRGLRFNWRRPSKCVRRCNKNEVLEMRGECPRTCLNPTGNYGCGVIKPVMGCHCRRGFVRNSQGKCIKPSQCGCRLPDGSGLLNIKQSLITSDCSERWTCGGNGKLRRIKLRKCGANATCAAVKHNQRGCRCKKGYYGNGYKCTRRSGKVMRGKINRRGSKVIFRRRRGSRKIRIIRRKGRKASRRRRVVVVKRTGGKRVRRQSRKARVIGRRRRGSRRVRQGRRSRVARRKGRKAVKRVRRARKQLRRRRTVRRTRIVRRSVISRRRKLLRKAKEILRRRRSIILRRRLVPERRIQSVQNRRSSLTVPPLLFKLTLNNVIGGHRDVIGGHRARLSNRCSSQDICFGHGDPYYRTFDGLYLDVPKSCSYVLLKENAANSRPSYSVIANHQNFPSHNSRTWIKSVTVNFDGNRYHISNKLKINGERQQLPYHGNNFNIYVHDSNIIFDSPLFSVTYDGIHSIKLRSCSKQVTGLCGNNNNISSDDLVNPDKFLVPSKKCRARSLEP